MAENNGTAPEGAKLTTEQLLTELGKLVFTINKQLGVVQQRVESIDSALAEGALQKLDRLIELMEASNSGLDAIGKAIGEGNGKIDAIDKKAEKIEKAVKGSTDKNVKELKNIVTSGKDLVKSITGLEGKMTAAFTDTGSRLNEGLKPVEESLSALMSRTDSVIEGVKTQTEEAARIAELPPHPDLVTKLDELTDEVKKSSETLSEKYVSEATRMIESPPHPDLVTKLDGILDQARTSGEAMDGSLSRTTEGIVTAISTSDSSRKALLEEKFMNLSDRMEIFPVSVNQLGENLTGKIEDFKEEAGKLLEEASTSLQKSSSTMETVEKIVEETKQEQNEVLARMMELVEKHRLNADEEEIEKLNSLAIKHYNNSEYTLAQDSVEKALMLGANRAELWSNLAHIKAAAEDTTGAEEAFLKALQLEPELDQAVSGLGVLMVDTGRPQETIEFLREFLMEDSPSLRTMMAYAKALSATGRHADALEMMSRASELAPDNPEIQAEISRYSESGSVNGLGSSIQSSTGSITESTAEPAAPVTESIAETLTEAVTEPRAKPETDPDTVEPVTESMADIITELNPEPGTENFLETNPENIFGDLKDDEDKESSTESSS